MDVKELSEWAETDEGKAWLDEQKAGLMKKRDELLTEVKNLGEKLTTANQRAADSEKLLRENRAAFEDHVVDGTLDKLMDEYDVLPDSRDAVRAAIRGSDLSVTDSADGGDREVQIDLEGQKQPLSDYFAEWSETRAAKAHRSAPDNAGGGAPGGQVPKTSDADAFTAAVIQAME